jgi:hypothetical protein
MVICRYVFALGPIDETLDFRFIRFYDERLDDVRRDCTTDDCEAFASELGVVDCVIFDTVVTGFDGPALAHGIEQ